MLVVRDDRGTCRGDVLLFKSCHDVQMVFIHRSIDPMFLSQDLGHNCRYFESGISLQQVFVAHTGEQELVEEGLRAHSAHALSVTADLETYEGALAAVAAAKDEFGRIDVLINNVGGTIWAKPYEHYTPQEIQKEIQRSLFPTLWMCRATFEVMVAAGGGTIVNVSSVATRGMNRVPYAAAKGGVKAITSALAMEGAPHGIRVVATAPGGTEAPERQVKRGPAPQGEQEQAWYQAIVDQTVDSTLLKRYGTLDEQSAPIVFLASDEASYITGATLAVAGGDLG